MDSFDHDPRTPPPPMTWRECVICNLELACLIASLVAFAWLLCDPEKEDAEAPGVVLRDGLDWQGLRG